MNEALFSDDSGSIECESTCCSNKGDMQTITVIDDYGVVSDMYVRLCQECMDLMESTLTPVDITVH